MAEHMAGDYYERRERQERRLAEAAQSPSVRTIHETLATRYARLAAAGDSPTARSRLHLVIDSPNGGTSAGSADHA